MSNKYFPSSSPDEMNEKPKMSADQESALDMHFNRNKTMHASDVAILSAETGLSEEQVQVFILLPSASVLSSEPGSILTHLLASRMT